MGLPLLPSCLQLFPGKSSSFVFHYQSEHQVLPSTLVISVSNVGINQIMHLGAFALCVCVCTCMYMYMYNICMYVRRYVNDYKWV